LYFRTSFPLWIGSRSKSFDADAPFPSLSSLTSVSFNSQTPKTRSPGLRRESQEARKPEITGKRLQRLISIARLSFRNRRAYPSCAGHVASDDSSASQIAAPSSSMTTSGSSKGRISSISPSVTWPGSRSHHFRRVIRRKRQTRTVGRVSTQSASTDEHPVRSPTSFHAERIVVGMSDYVRKPVPRRRL